MVLKLKNVTDLDINKVDKLYHSAFPIEERTSLEVLVRKANENKGAFLSIYDEDKWVGLTYVITYQDLSYVLYLAIDDTFRGKGYGSQTLELLKIKYPHTIMLCIEEVEEKYENYKQRLSRKQFYLRNGLKEMGFKYFEADVKYEMLYYGKKLPSKTYDDLMVAYAGNIYHNYRDYNQDEIY